ncbi:MAG: flavodoxin [Clostridiales bacterium]|nr:flavodoxin [Clostridiales bacterium]
MKILIIVKSKGTGNTMQIAEAMAEAVPATITALEEVHNYNLEGYDLIGLGSGIFFGKHYKDLIKFAETLKAKNCFVFSTSGYNNLEKVNGALVKLLEAGGNNVLGSFACRGVFLGKNKGHPNTDDFDNAQKFIGEVIEKYNHIQ